MGIETSESRAALAEKVLTIVDSFIASQGITFAEMIYDTDDIIVNAYGFIERLCDAAGYAERDDG